MEKNNNIYFYDKFYLYITSDFAFLFLMTWWLYNLVDRGVVRYIQFIIMIFLFWAPFMSIINAVYEVYYYLQFKKEIKLTKTTNITIEDQAEFINPEVLVKAHVAKGIIKD